MSTFYGALPAKFPRSTSAPRASGTGFGMASGSRLFTDWPSVTITTDSILRSELVKMRNRSRQLARDEDYMRAFLISCRNNIIGPNGASLTMDVRDPSGESDDLANDAIEAGWDEFSKAWGFDSSGKYVPHFCTNASMGRVEFSHLGITTAARDGEFYYRLVRGFDNPWAFSVQPIAPDYIDEEKNEALPNGSRIVMGVQKNSWGQVTHYWLRAWNPGDVYQTGGQRNSTQVPASEIRRFMVPDDFELSRGYPWIHAGATRLKMLGGYEEAALEAARSAACKHEYFTQTPDANGDYQGDAQDADGNFLSDVEPGQKEILPVGMNVQSIDPAYPHTDHRPFINATLMGVAAGLGLSYSALTGDLTQANYSSLRAGLLPERDMWRLMQSLWICQVEMPIFLEWLRMSLLSRAIKLPNGAALPIAKFDKFAKPVFQGRRWAWVDPQKDQNANAIALDQMLTTRAAVATEQGSDFEEILRGRAREKKLFEKYDLKEPLSDAEAKAGAAFAAAPPQEAVENDEETPEPTPQAMNFHVNVQPPAAPVPVVPAAAPQPVNLNVEIKAEANKPVKKTVLLTRDARGAATGAQIVEE